MKTELTQNYINGFDMAFNVVSTLMHKKKTRHSVAKILKIKISNEFQSTMPRSDKLVAKYDYTKNQIMINKKYNVDRNIFQSQIVLDKRNNLLDGYTSYLLAKMLGIKKVDVIVQER